jgi:hypothetical protein
MRSTFYRNRMQKHGGGQSQATTRYTKYGGLISWKLSKLGQNDRICFWGEESEESSKHFMHFRPFLLACRRSHMLSLVGSSLIRRLTFSHTKCYTARQPSVRDAARPVVVEAQISVTLSSEMRILVACLLKHAPKGSYSGVGGCAYRNGHAATA